MSRAFRFCAAVYVFRIPSGSNKCLDTTSSKDQHFKDLNNTEHTKTMEKACLIRKSQAPEATKAAIFKEGNALPGSQRNTFLFVHAAL